MRKWLTALLCLSCLLAPFGWTEEVGAQVESVHDGDTLRLTTGQRVRLWGIDCPELDQPYGRQAQQAAEAAVAGRTVVLEVHGNDRYGRILAVVRVDGRSLNEQLLELGLAWWYRRYAPSEHRYRDLEKQARSLRRGLWSQTAPLAPWDYRHH